MDMTDLSHKRTVSKYLNFLFTRSASLGEAFYIQMEIDGMYLGEGGFAVVLLELQDAEHAAEHVALSERLEAILRQRLAQFAIHYVDSHDNRLSCLLAFPRLKANTQAVGEHMLRLRGIMEDVHKTFTVEMGKGLICVASNMEFGTAAIQMAYSETVDFLQYLQFVRDKATVASLSDAEGSTRSQMDENLFLSDCADQISRLLQGQQYSEAKDRMLLALEYCVTAVPWFFTNMRLRLITFFNHLVLALIRQNQITRSFFTEHDILTSLMMAERKQALQTAVTQFWQALVTQLEEMDRQPDLLWVAAVNEYIAKMSTDPNLSVQQIAEHFGMAQPAASSRYKKYAGCTLSDGIHTTRIWHAKQLLQSSAMPLSKIAETVGYGSLATMNRAFQKHEGVAPRRLRSR